MRTLFFLPFLLLAGCAPALPPPASRAPATQASDTKSPPNGLGDFLFGMTVEEAEAKCREVGSLSTTKDENSLWATTRRCDGAEILGLPVRFVSLHFCRTTGRLCEVVAFTPTSDLPRTADVAKVGLLSAKLLGAALERRFGPPTAAQESPLTDACVKGPHAADLPGPYRRDWSWSAPVSRVRAVFQCDERDLGFYLFAQDADGVRVRALRSDVSPGGDVAKP
jgi:hypothetical protein